MITVISVVKNSADVIESMIRGNAAFADRFVILDNMSTDRTAEIIGKLIEEGFPVELIPDEEQSHLQKEKMRKLMGYVIEKYAPDFIIALDDDEILVPASESLEPEDMKAAIGGLDRNDLYYVCWRNYIPTDEDDKDKVCVMERETFCFDDEAEMTMKVLIPAGLIDESFTIADGNHYADGDRIRNRVVLNDLRIAHYPVRSPQQIASKALVGWINNLTMAERAKGLNYHWERMYNAVKNGGLPSMDMMQAMCTLYREHPNDEEHLNIVKRPASLCREAFEIKYTGRNEVNVLSNLCSNAENLAAKYAELVREKEKLK